jgi:hypothetical protein
MGASILKISSSSSSSDGFNKNAIINGGFTVNQRVYVSAATLATTVYGHDRWKAGAAGGDYSFTQLANNTQITIASGKTLIQVVEDKNVVGGTYTLSWEGTAQGRYAINSVTPAGSYVDSPITIIGQTAGTVMSVEFDAGTLGKVQLELGSTATNFVYRQFQDELALCQRYYCKSYNIDVGLATVTNVGASQLGTYSTDQNSNPMSHTFVVNMRTTPTLVGYSPHAGTISKCTDVDASTDKAVTLFNIGSSGFVWQVGEESVTGNRYSLHWTAASEL